MAEISVKILAFNQQVVLLFRISAELRIVIVSYSPDTRITILCLEIGSCYLLLSVSSVSPYVTTVSIHLTVISTASIVYSKCAQHQSPRMWVVQLEKLYNLYWDNIPSRKWKIKHSDCAKYFTLTNHGKFPCVMCTAPRNKHVFKMLFETFTRFAFLQNRTYQSRS
jgi:hypothetical protein